MLRSLAKIAAHLEIDNAANRVLEALYSNKGGANPLFARRFQVLTYHKVSRDPHPFFEPVHPDVFEKQMQFINRCYRVMPLMELLDRSRRGDVPARAVAITFDDGYRDNYDHAFPILKKYRLPATIFVTTGAIETGEILWHDRIFDSFRFASVRLPDLSLQTVLSHAKRLYGEAQRRFVEEIENALKPRVDAHLQQRMLSWQQIREMHAAGMEFGSHTVSHPILSRIPRNEMVKELRQSRRQLSEHLDSPVPSFAYPNGLAADYNDEVKAVVKESGYRCAVTSRCGFNNAFSDPFELRRGQPWQKEIDLFRMSFFLQRHGLN